MSLDTGEDSAATDKAANASQCLPYPKTTADGDFSAEELVTNGDTGRRRVEGAIRKTAAVKSSERVDDDAAIPPQRGSAIYFISFQIGDRIVTLAHTDLDDTGTPTGSGLWAAVDSYSELATNFPYDPTTPMAETLKASLETDGAKESRDCVS